MKWSLKPRIKINMNSGKPFARQPTKKKLTKHQPADQHYQSNITPLACVTTRYSVCLLMLLLCNLAYRFHNHKITSYFIAVLQLRRGIFSWLFDAIFAWCWCTDLSLKKKVTNKQVLTLGFFNYRWEAILLDWFSEILSISSYPSKPA